MEFAYGPTDPGEGETVRALCRRQADEIRELRERVALYRESFVTVVVENTWLRAHGAAGHGDRCQSFPLVGEIDAPLVAYDLVIAYLDCDVDAELVTRAQDVAAELVAERVLGGARSLTVTLEWDASSVHVEVADGERVIEGMSASCAGTTLWADLRVAA